MKTLAGIIMLTILTGIGAPFAGAQDDGLEFHGLILDQTRTMIGRNFYEYFSSQWEPVDGIDYTITITEMADPLRGSVVEIRVNDTLTFRKNVSPRNDEIEEAARQGASRTRHFILNRMELLKELEMF